jgi:hypothetical protein
MTKEEMKEQFQVVKQVAINSGKPCRIYLSPEGVHADYELVAVYGQCGPEAPTHQDFDMIIGTDIAFNAATADDNGFFDRAWGTMKTQQEADEAYINQILAIAERANSRMLEARQRLVQAVHQDQTMPYDSDAHYELQDAMEHSELTLELFKERAAAGDPTDPIVLSMAHHDLFHLELALEGTTEPKAFKLRISLADAIVTQRELIEALTREPAKKIPCTKPIDSNIVSR